MPVPALYTIYSFPLIRYSQFCVSWNIKNSKLLHTSMFQLVHLNITSAVIRKSYIQLTTENYYLRISCLFYLFWFWFLSNEDHKVGVSLVFVKNWSKLGQRCMLEVLHFGIIIPEESILLLLLLSFYVPAVIQIWTRIFYTLQNLNVLTFLILPKWSWNLVNFWKDFWNDSNKNLILIDLNELF